MLIENDIFWLFKNTIERYGWIDLPANGNSMYPFIKKGDICRFNNCDPLCLKKGDVILFCSRTNQLIAHRLHQIKTINHRLYFIVKGDTNLGFDEPLKREQIIGRLSSLQRKGSNKSVHTLPSYILKKIMIHFPIISSLLRLYMNRRFV